MKDVWGHSGSMDQSLSEFEIRHRILAREAAEELSLIHISEPTRH